MSNDLQDVVVRQSKARLEDASRHLASARRDLKKAYIVSGIAIAISIINIVYILVRVL